MNLLEEIYIQQFFAELIKLQNEDKIQTGLDHIFEACDNLIINNKIKIVDNILKNQNIDDLNVDYLIGLLTITLPIKDVLVYRLDVYSQAEEGLINLKYDRTRIVRILNGLQ